MGGIGGVGIGWCRGCSFWGTQQGWVFRGGEARSIGVRVYVGLARVGGKNAQPEAPDEPVVLTNSHDKAAAVVTSEWWKNRRKHPPQNVNDV